MRLNTKPVSAANLLALARLDIEGLRELVFVDPDDPDRVSFPNAGSPAARQVIAQIDDLSDVLDQLAAAPLLSGEPG